MFIWSILVTDTGVDDVHVTFLAFYRVMIIPCPLNYPGLPRGPEKFIDTAICCEPARFNRVTFANLLFRREVGIDAAISLRRRQGLLLT
jgi:hypothetical protein